MRIRYLMWLSLLNFAFQGVAVQASVEGQFEWDSGDTKVALIELFSSQGCSSCPPAERWISGLKDHDQLWQSFVPVVFHVDYWDYLGWRDPFASIKYSQRQRRYQLHGRCNAVYTPGFMFSGQEWAAWFQRPELPEIQAQSVGQLKVSVAEQTAHVRFLRQADNRGLVLNVALLGFGLVTDISKGENSGRRLPQDFVVLSHQETVSDDGMWNVALPQADNDVEKTAVRYGLAFWVSHGSDPTPIQATGGWISEKGQSN